LGSTSRSTICMSPAPIQRSISSFMVRSC